MIQCQDVVILPRLEFDLMLHACNAAVSRGLSTTFGCGSQTVTDRRR
ncbi:MAG: hypothetical protein AB2693_15395 [Candidatus Thiodiazotropha sp.]